MSRIPGWVSPLAGAAVLVALGLQFGADAFVAGLRRVDAAALLVALLVTAGTTWCCARRWSLVAGRLGVPVGVAAAYRACHRAQFLNAVLPGGVAGDVHRAARHGRDAGALGRGLGSVVGDRVSGQVVQIAMALAALGWLLTPGRRTALALLALAVLGAVACALGSQVVLLSLLAAGGHVVVFVVAARTAGVSAPLTQLVPLALLVLVAAAIPLGFAGWGPREGAAAWLFGAAGLGGATGVEVTVAYGVMSLVATLPGALVLVSGRRAPASYSEAAEVAHG